MGKTEYALIRFSPDEDVLMNVVEVEVISGTQAGDEVQSNCARPCLDHAKVGGGVEAEVFLQSRQGQFNGDHIHGFIVRGVGVRVKQPEAVHGLLDLEGATMGERHKFAKMRIDKGLPDLCVHLWCHAPKASSRSRPISAPARLK